MSASSTSYPASNLQDSRSGPARKIAIGAALFFLVLGTAFRVKEYAADTSLFSDEAALVLNFRTHAAGQLVKHLDYGQAAPPVFLWIGRAAYLRFGTNEYALRFLPMAAGVLSLWLFAWIAWRLFPMPVAAVAIGWYAFCEKLISFSAELKQYGTDALSAVVLFAVAFVWGSKRSPLSRLVCLSAVAACLLWLSHTTIILYAAFAAILLWQCRRDGIRAIALGILSGLAIGGSFGVLYFFSIRHQQVPLLFNFWREGFPDRSHPLRFPIWLIRQTYELFDNPYRYTGFLTVPLSIFGAMHLWKTGRRDLLAACLLPAAFTALAACARQYPFNGSRLTLFLFPGLFILFACGLVAVRDWLQRGWHLAWLIPAAVMLAMGLGTGSNRVFHPHYRSHIRPVVAYVRQHLQPGDALYLLGESGPKNDPLNSPGRHLELLAYWPDPPAVVHTEIHSLSDIHERRFWVVLAFRPHIKNSLHLFDEFKKTADPVGEPFVLEQGAAACLFELRDTSGNLH